MKLLKLGCTLSSMYLSAQLPSFYYKHLLTMSYKISTMFFSTAVSTRAHSGASADQQYCHQLETPPQPRPARCQVLPCVR